MIFKFLLLFFATTLFSLGIQLAFGKNANFICPNSNHSRPDIIFDRDHFGVGFIPQVSFDHYVNYNLREDDVDILLRKVYTKFDNIIVTYFPSFRRDEDSNEYAALNNYIPVIAAQFNANLKPESNPIRLTFSIFMSAIINEGQRVLIYLQSILGIVEKIHLETVERILVHFDNSDVLSLNMFVMFDSYLDYVLNDTRNYERGVIFDFQICASYPFQNGSESILQKLLAYSRVDIIYFYIDAMHDTFGVMTFSHLKILKSCSMQLKEDYPGLKVGILSSFPDANQDGSANYTNFVNFWGMMNSWAREENISVFFNRAFDIPFARTPTTGWWRLIPGSYRNASDFRFEDKLCLQDRPRSDGNEFKTTNATWLKNLKFSRELGVTLDMDMFRVAFMKGNITFKFEDFLLKIQERFSKVAITMIDTPFIPHLERVAELSKNGNFSSTVTVLFKHVNLNLLIETCEKMNKISPGIVKTVIFSPLARYMDQIYNAIGHVWDYKNETEGSERYSWGVLLDLRQCMPNSLWSIKRESGAWDVLIFSTLWLDSNWFKLIGIEMEINSILAWFEVCKRRVKEFEGMEKTEVVLMTGWAAREEKDYLNLIRFWEAVNNWAIKTNTKVFMYEAIDNLILVPDEITLPSHYGWWKLTSPDKIESKQEIALRMAEESQQVPEPPSKTVELTGVVFLILGLLLGIFILIAYFARKRKLRYLTKDDLETFFNGTGNKKDSETEMGYNRSYFEMGKESFKIDRKATLGSGAFGKVCKGSVLIDGIRMDVAVKMTKRICTQTSLKGLLSEIKVLSYVGKHENVVKLIGAYTAELKRSVLFVFLEFCELGSLESYLREWDLKEKKRNRSKEVDQGIEMSDLKNDEKNEKLKLDMTQWAYDIANGMEFIARKNVVHMDLATRNVLLSSSKTAKISDFGLSRRLDNYQMYIKNGAEPLPWRWMSPESLKRAEFTEKSDVWAFGVTLWEICSLAEIPYPGLEWDPNFATFLENGIRLGTTKFNPNDMQKVMQCCWATDPDDRPTFSELKIELKSKVDVNKKKNDNISTRMPIYDVLQ